MTAVPMLDRRSEYVSAVAVELADLAPDDRAELIEELDDHIAALLEDRPDVDLVAELGSPQVYAHELRTAAGLVADPAARPTVSTRLRDLARQVDTSLPWLRPFLRFLRPAWWVMRGVVVGAAVGLPLGFGYPSGGAYVLIGLGVLASLWVAQRAPMTLGWRVGVRVLNVAAVVLTLYVLSVLTAYRVASYDQAVYDPQCPVDLSNLYAYDASGVPIEDVRLYDQSGQPFDISQFGCAYSGGFLPTGAPNVYPWPSDPGGSVPEPTGPPASLAPLPGATVPPPPTPSGSGAPTPSGTPSASPTR